jgi:hypothetical protein
MVTLLAYLLLLISLAGARLFDHHQPAVRALRMGVPGAEQPVEKGRSRRPGFQRNKAAACSPRLHLSVSGGARSVDRRIWHRGAGCDMIGETRRRGKPCGSLPSS